MILVSQIGPLSGYSIGKKAQSARLQTLLEEVGVSQNGTLSKIEYQASREPENQIASILDYLKDRHGSAQLEAMFPELDYEDTSHYELPRFIMESYGLVYRYKYERRQNWDDHDYSYRNFNTNSFLPLEISGYDWKVSPTRSHWNQEAHTING